MSSPRVPLRSRSKLKPEVRHLPLPLRLLTLCTLLVLVPYVALFTLRSPQALSFLAPQARREPAAQEAPSFPVPLFAGHLPKQPVALVFVGGLRSFNNSHVRRSVVQNVLHTLRAAGHPVHTFFHVDKPTHLTAQVLAPFEPASVTQTTRAPCPPARNCSQTPLKGLTLPFVLCRAAEVWPVVRAAERAQGRPFAWVYRLRPDLAFLRPLPLPDALDGALVHVNTHMPGLSERGFPYLADMLGERRTKLLVPRMGDHMAIVARPLAPLLFRAVESYDNCHLRGINYTLNPEVGMAYWLASHSVQVRVHQWFWLLVRDKTGPQCFRVKQLSDDKDDRENRVAECERTVRRWGYTPLPKKTR